MRRKVITTVVTFSTTTAAMKMERTARESEFPGRLIPIPSEISTQVRTMAWIFMTELILTRCVIKMERF